MPEEQPAKPRSKAIRKRTALKRPPGSGEIPTATEKADQAAEEFRGKLIGMLDLAAILRADRRRATATDRVDFEAAFDDIVNPISRLSRLALVGDVCGIFGAGFIGYSINIYTGSGTPHQTGHIAILAGVILSVAGASLKYLDPSR